MNYGFPEVFSIKLAAFTQVAIEKVAPERIPDNIQGRAIQCLSIPPLWRKIFANGRNAYFCTNTLEFQTDVPGITANEIERYSPDDLRNILRDFGFKTRIFGRDIFSVFKKENITGKGLVKRSYNELVSLNVPREDAKNLRLILSPLMTKADLIKFDVEDTCIWAEKIGVSSGSRTIFREQRISGKDIVDPDCLAQSFRALNIIEGDIIKVVKAVKNMNYESFKKMGMVVSNDVFAVPNQKLSSLSSLLASFPPNYYRTLAEALEDAKFVDSKDMLIDAKRKWESSSDAKKSGLTEEEAAAIFVYTYDFGKDKWEKNPFRIVNKILAERNTHDLPRLCGYILHLLSALRKLPKWTKKNKLYRGVDGPVGSSVKQVGNVMTWPAFTSTTVDEGAVGMFITNLKDPVVFEIRGSFCGYDISPFSALSSEAEVLLEPETMFRVVEVRKDSKFPGATRIVVDIVENPPMIEDMVLNFNREKERHAPVKGKGITQWDIVDATPFVKKSAIEMIGTPPPPYCTLLDAFKRAGFGCTYEAVEKELQLAATKRKVPINSLRRLSDEEAFAIFSYTIEGGSDSRPYCVVNKALTERNAQSHRVYPYVFYLLSALRKLSLYRSSRTLYRAVNGEQLNEDTYRVGSILTWPSFMPVSFDKNRAYEFVCKSNEIDKKVVFVITGEFKGYNISDYTLYPEECEILLEPESKFQITSIGPDLSNPSITIISMTIIETSLIIKDFIDAFMKSERLPQDWMICIDPGTGKVFYGNPLTKETQWNFPGSEVEKEGEEDGKEEEEEKKKQVGEPQKKLPLYWEECIDPGSGRKFYQNTQTKITQWDFPVEEEKDVEENKQQNEEENKEKEEEENKQQGSQQSLPPHWEECVDPRSGRKYYKNLLTKTTQWEFPKSLPPYWEECIDPGSGRKFYQNTQTKVTQWDFPTN